MPNCDDGGCSCRIIAGAGITITGSGSLSAPFEVSTGGFTDLFRVNDTTTVNLTLRGTGVADDPFILSADSALRLTQLLDVADPEGGPAVGESPVWTGVGVDGHWEFKTPPPAPAGAVNATLGVAGTGTVGDPIKASLVSETAGATTGSAVYVDTAGKLRVAPPTSATADWSTITNKPSTFPPATHTHTVAQISDPANFTGTKSVGNALKVMNHQVFTGTTTPASPVAGDLWFKKA